METAQQAQPEESRTIGLAPESEYPQTVVADLIWNEQACNIVRIMHYNGLGLPYRAARVELLRACDCEIFWFAVRRHR